MGFGGRNCSRRMHLVPVTFLLLLSGSLACRSDSTSYDGTGIVCRLTKPAALVLNQQTAELIQTAFHNAKYPDIKGEKSVRFLGKIAYGLTNIHIHGLTIEKSEVDFKEDVAIGIGIQNVSASFRGTLSYGYVGAWVMKLAHSIDFEIKSAIDLQLAIKLTCEKERVLVETPDCNLNFHELILHLQGEKNPGWLKQLFTNFISFTLKLILKNQVCKEINVISQGLADFVQDTTANFFRDGDIGVDVSLASFPVIKANYVESHHKGLLRYKDYSGIGRQTVFTPSLLPESRMLYFWFSGHVLNSLVSAAFLDGRLELTITGDELKEMFESKELEPHRDMVDQIFQGASGNDSTARVWSLDAPRIVLQPEGTVVKSSVAVELGVPSQGNETSVLLYFEQDITVTIQASYVQRRLVLHLLKAIIKPKTLNCAPHIAVNDETLRLVLENVTKEAGIPEVISRIEPVLTSMLDSRGIHLFDLHDPEIITKEGYFIIQMDFGFPHHILTEFLNRTL